MRILHVMSEMDPRMGGVAQAIKMLISSFSQSNIENELVSLDNPRSPFLAESTYTIHALGPNTRPWCYSKKLVPWLVENLRRFDVVIVHGIWLYHSYATCKAINRIKGVKGRIPALFVMPHGMLDPYFQRADGRKLKAIRNGVYWKAIEQNVINSSDGLLFTSLKELELARETFYPYRPKREIVVGLGIDDPPAYTAQVRQSFLEKCPDLKNDPYFLFLGRIDYKKGVDLLVEAYQKLAERFVASKGVLSKQKEFGHTNTTLPKLVIAGPGLESTYGLVIQQLASRLPEFKNFFIFPGMLTGDAKWGAFYGCEAFILPSHQENFGIAVVEALACGKPVLISDKVNIWKEIDDAGAGLVSSDTLEGTEQLLQSWNKLREEEKRLKGKQARECFEKRFQILPVATKIIDAVAAIKTTSILI